MPAIEVKHSAETSSTARASGFSEVGSVGMELLVAERFQLRSMSLATTVGVAVRAAKAFHKPSSSCQQITAGGSDGERQLIDRLVDRNI